MKSMLTYPITKGEILMQKYLLSLLFVAVVLEAGSSSGKKVFETYCWGCHHQSAEAFGPSFIEIASKRSGQEISAMITDPDGVSKIFGYKRNAMPKIKLKPKELKLITEYILSFKPREREVK